MVEYIRKRDGSIQRFLPEKIEFAIYRALKSVNIDDLPLATRLTQKVIEKIEKDKIPTVEEIQDIVENVLIENGLYDVAKSYILYREKRKQIRESKKILGIEDKLKLSVNSINVLRKRYLLRNEKGEIIETPDEMFGRVAKYVSMCEKEKDKYEEEFYNIMANLEFLPNSPTLMNAGTSLGQLSACFVLPVEDSIDGIFTTLKNMALIHKSGGGTGFSFSNLRPKGDIVGSTKGVASGPVSFMEIYDKATEIVKQGGKRRGANMGILNYNHPDIYEFITSKRKNILTNFNISVAVSDEFMEKVIKKEKYPLINPRNGEKVREVYANEVFDLISQSAWEVGDPGLIYIDEINRHNPTPSIGKIEATNPCLSGNTWILTPDGPFKIKEIVGKFTAISLNGKFYHTNEDGFFYSGEKDVFKIITKKGYELKATEEHPLRSIQKITRYKTYEIWKKVKELKSGDKIILCNNRETYWKGDGKFEEGYLLGLLIGDGTLKKEIGIISVWGNNEGAKSVIYEAENASKILPHRKDFKGFIKVSNKREEYRLKMASIRDLAVKFGILPGRKIITEKVEKTGYEFYKGFIRGIFDADGTVVGNLKKGVSIRLWQKDINNIKIIQRMLLRMGIVSQIYKFRKCKGKKLLPDGKNGYKYYYVEDGHELVISKDNIEVFARKIGFGNIEKRKKLENLLNSFRRKLNRERFIDEIEKIEYCGREKVYDVQVPGINAFDANGFYVHNCGEQPLLPYESCNLGSINLTKILENGRINWEKLEKVIEIAVRFLDDVIDVNKYPLPEIEKMTKANRKIGLGIMGWADLLLELKIPYGSDESFTFAENLMRFINEKAFEYSVKIGREKGSFPNFEKSIYYNKVDALRNATRTTIAPTGSISIIANCSSGIEPIFGVAFVRNILEGTKFVEINPVFEKIAKEEKFLNAEILKEIIKTGSLKNIKDIPEEYKKIFLTALDIEPLKHLKMQSIFQKYTDNAVSKTVNLPYQATIEEVKEIFINGWKMKCKGVTVFRYGSKTSQVLSYGSSLEEIDYLILPEEISSCSKGICFY